MGAATTAQLGSSREWARALRPQVRIAEHEGLHRPRRGFGPEPQQRGTCQHRAWVLPSMGSSADVTVHISLRYDAIARVTPCHGLLETTGPVVSMERMYRCPDGAIVSNFRCFASGPFNSSTVIEFPPCVFSCLRCSHSRHPANCPSRPRRRKPRSARVRARAMEAQPSCAATWPTWIA